MIRPCLAVVTAVMSKPRASGDDPAADLAGQVAAR